MRRLPLSFYRKGVAITLKPETERLLREELVRGRFDSADELIAEAVSALREKSRNQSARPRKSLLEVLSEPPFAGSELNLERQPDLPRSLDL